MRLVGYSRQNIDAQEDWCLHYAFFHYWWCLQKGITKTTLTIQSYWTPITAFYYRETFSLALAIMLNIVHVWMLLWVVHHQKVFTDAKEFNPNAWSSSLSSLYNITDWRVRSKGNNFYEQSGDGMLYSFGVFHFWRDIHALFITSFFIRLASLLADKRMYDVMSWLCMKE